MSFPDRRVYMPEPRRLAGDSHATSSAANGDVTRRIRGRRRGASRRGRSRGRGTRKVEDRPAGQGGSPPYGPHDVPGDGGLLAALNGTVRGPHERHSQDRVLQDAHRGILAHGGASFAGALAARGLIDEYCLVIQPVAVGGGQALFAELSAPLRMELVDARSFTCGVVAHVYRPR